VHYYCDALRRCPGAPSEEGEREVFLIRWKGEREKGTAKEPLGEEKELIEKRFGGARRQGGKKEKKRGTLYLRTEEKK